MKPIAIFLILALLGICSDEIAAQSKPNVVLILADDLGWSDTTLFGTTKLYVTPNIERLAKRGMTFTHAYSSSPLCSPTRSSVMTGLSPARTDITAPNCHLNEVILQSKRGSKGGRNQKAILPVSATRLSTDHYTLAEMFRDNGYATAHFGKWHLGAEPYSPLQHGFDIDIPHWPGPGPAGSFVAPWKFPDFDPQIPHEHIEDRMADDAVKFMTSHADGPFFLNYWMFSVHAPFDAKQTLIDQYKSKVDPNDPQRSPIYAAMVHSMDDAIGTLLDALDRLKIADNTIIVFASDNGGNMYNEVDGTTPTSNAPLRGGKATMYEGGVRGPAIVAFPATVAPGSRSDAVIQSSDFYPTLLDLLSIQPQPQQSFDGISIVPALRGGSLDREAIFTFFPHSPGVPDWLPPAVSVHRGDWKLIRLFCNGENGKHRYKLFNLNDDIGENHDLSASKPELLAELDSLIEGFLTDTGAALPIPNPDFDPSTYDINLEGKVASKMKPAAKPAPAGKRVAGWQPEGTCSLAVENGQLVVSSNGIDPHFSRPLPKAIAAKKLMLKFTMTSSSAGQGQIFWHEEGVKPAYFSDRSVTFDVQHDGKPHSYEIPFETAHRTLAIRIDPSKGAGEMRLSNIQLMGADGNVLYQAAP